MTSTISTGRRSEAAQVDPVFMDRWSPRSFSPEPLSEGEIEALFEAARWAPSSANSQPWEFLYATDGAERELFNSLLREGNQRWAPGAPMLVFVLARKLSDAGRPLRTNMFDAGAAWMSFALQARKLGLYTHAMGGILIDEIPAALGIPEDEFDVVCAIAVGRKAPAEDLPEDMREREGPNQRKPLSEVARKWTAPG